MQREAIGSSLYSILTEPREILRWWWDELGNFVPGIVTRAVRANVITLAICTARGEVRWAYSILLGQPIQWRSRNTASTLVEALQATAPMRRLLGPLVSLGYSLEKDDCLVREVWIPAQARQKATEIALLDLERRTPFDRTSAFVGHDVGAVENGHVLVTQYVVKADKLSIDDDDQSLPNSPAELHVREHGRLTGIMCRLERSRKSGLVNRVSLHVLAVLFLTVCLLSASTTALHFWAQSERIELLENEIVAVRSKVLQHRAKRVASVKEFERLNSLAKRKMEQPSALAVWADVTRHLPDTAWLLRLSIDGGVITLDGQSRAAGSILEELSKSKALANVRMSGAIVRDPRLGLERFRVMADIVRQEKRTNVEGSSP